MTTVFLPAFFAWYSALSAALISHEENRHICRDPMLIVL